MEKLKKYKKMRNYIKNKLGPEEEKYYSSKFYNKEASVGSLWNSVNDFLNSSKQSHSNTPTLLTYKNKTYSSPRDIANVFNQIFINKVKKLTEKTSNDPKVEPKKRLEAWLKKKEDPIEEFELKAITTENLRKIMKKLKGHRSSGIHFIKG